MGPADLEQIFTSCKLEIVVPDGEFHLPESFSSHGLQWLHDTKQDGNVRDVAFFDERLHCFLAVTIPSDCLSSTSSSTNQGNSDADAVPARLALFLAHLQVSMDLSYVPPVPSPTPNPPPNSSPHLQLPPAPHQSRTPPSHGVGPVPLQPPHTPSPIPATTGSDTAYASARNVESSPVVHSYIWGETRDVVDSERRFSVFLQHEEDGDVIPKGTWVLVYRLDVPVVYVPTRFANPLLCLTASATLREKRVRATPERESLISLITPIVNKVIPPTSPESLEDSSAEDLMDGFEEVNLFEGITKGVTFSAESADKTLFLPSSRLSDSMRRHGYSLHPPKSATQTLTHADRRTPNSQFMTPTPRAGSIPTLRKSFRKVLAAVSGIRVRMRTTFVPYFVIPGTECDEELEERRDAGNEERTVILSLEVENVPDSGRGFEVERVDVSVGGEGAKAQLIRWGPAVEKDEDIFPLRLRSADQYNLLYAVSFVHPHALDIKPAASNNSLVGGNTLPESHRPMSIVVTGRPWVPEDSTTKPPSTLPPVKTFTSRWSSILDLTATGNMADPYERPPSPLSEQDTLPMPASPFPLASPTSAKPMTSMSSLSSFTLDSPVSLHGKAPSTPVSPVAGSKRHTIASLSQRSDRFGLGRKLLMANHRASTPVPHSNIPPPPQLPAPRTPNKRAPSPLHTSHTTSTSISQPPLSIAVPNIHQSPTINVPTSGPVPNTPAFPSYHPSDATIPPSPHSQNPVAMPSGSGPSVEPRRQKMANGALPPTPMPGGRFASSAPPDRPWLQPLNPSGEVLLVSVSLIPPATEDIYPQDKFALDIFVFNKSRRARRCQISYPDRKRWRKEQQQVQVQQRGSVGHAVRESKAHPVFEISKAIGIVPLENHIQIGPLQPDSCQSVRMQFMALQEGVYTIDALTLRDLESDKSTNLRSVMHVVIRETKPPSDTLEDEVVG